MERNMAPVNEEVSEVEKDIFTKIANNDVNGLKNTLLQQKMKVDIYDENGMTPLQHAAYKGNKEIVQMLLDQVSVKAVCTCKYSPERMPVD
jgi:ankyrin repeat protein